MDLESLTTLPADPLLALGVAFLAGLLSVATPCVLPMIPMTLAAIGITKTTSRGRAVLNAAAYMAGIVLTFTSLGVAFALSGVMLGSLLAHPATAIAVAAIFVAMAASCFGWFSLNVPGPIMNAAAKIGGKGPLGALAAGLVAGVIATPCIGPVLAAILSYVSVTRDAAWGAALLAAYGIGFGLPFLAVGAFALRTPKSGPWTEAVKGVFGIALLVGAFWFLRGAFPALRGFGSVQNGLVAVSVGVIAYVALTALKDRTRAVRAWAAVSAALATVGGAFIINAALVQQLRWCNETPEGACLPATCQANARTIVLFTAEWCPACHELESTTLVDPRVSARLDGYGTVLVDVDRNPDLAAQANVSGIPTMIVLDGECRAIGGLQGYRDADDFIDALDQIESR